jgi:uncharacterized oxidoreductase
MADIHHFQLPALRAAIAELVRGFGSQPTEVDLVTDNLLAANLTGHDSHGVGMLPRYTESFLEGGLKPNAHIETRVDQGTLVGLDGHSGFGQVVGHETMLLGIERTKTHGSCILALGNAHHLCRIGAWAEMAVAQDLIAIHFVSVLSRPVVAPWDGGDARFGTNPFCVGIPVDGQPPVVLDFATSVIAQGKARVAHNKGEALKPGQIIDDKGQPTTDPVFAVKAPMGALRTFGEHKGFGLALVCELLGGALANAMTMRERPSGSRVHNGMLTILLDPKQLAQGNRFVQESMAFIEWVKASPPMAGTSGVKIAGEPERITRAQRTANGIPVDSNTWRDILIAAEKLGRDPQLIQRLAQAG